mmetsp:Transcript_7270/g.17467  ORF Transcript_7270/g.17467 Transcript_7270/m.17467 type:complete len:109 (+) Transcript_7270:1245-1571(+)
MVREGGGWSPRRQWQKPMQGNQLPQTLLLLARCMKQDPLSPAPSAASPQEPPPTGTGNRGAAGQIRARHCAAPCANPRYFSHHSGGDDSSLAVRISHPVAVTSSVCSN